MLMRTLIGKRYRETPSECQIASHAFMLRGGYIKPVGNGIYTLLTPVKRITRKIEGIIRQEMEAVGAQEVLFPVTMPASLWEQSGRYAHVGSELMRLTDRNGQPLVLGMTHEEAAVQLMRDALETYSQYPALIYQIQTKFRDEPRSRGGLIRVREFTMKDAYSFHTSQEDLERTYRRVFDAYHRIFTRIGLPEVIDVAGDSGMMGGSVSHEYMLPAAAGEDTLALCDCGYRANLEAAPCRVVNAAGEQQPLRRVDTPQVKTLDQLSDFLAVPLERTCKAVAYRTASGEAVVVFLRGDLQVNETKVRNLLGEEISPAQLENSGLHAGFIGPVGLTGARALFDASLQGVASMVCGANQEDAHLTGVSLARDVGEVIYHDLAKAREGGICPRCGRPSLTLTRGIEVGNIFQLGDRYTRPMGMTYTDEQGRIQVPLMGCYGIGVGRLAASICEARHDACGPIWPMAVAPWQVHICALRADQPDVLTQARALYDALQRQGLEVLLDDRAVSAGVMFSDADLLGVPLRVILSPRNLKDDAAEVISRDHTFSQRVPLADAPAQLAAQVAARLA